MLAKDLIKRIRKIEITTRRVVEDTLSGQYHSVFKGRGMAFDEVRAYQPGDEIRDIDWNVSARMNQVFVKRFVEERELTVMILVDLSASADFGSNEKTKAEVAAEIAALLAFSAISNNDRVGLLLFTDRMEKFVPPRKGRKHALRIVSEILQFQPTGKGTDLRAGIEYLRNVIKRKTVTFLISDFMDERPAPPPKEGTGRAAPPARGQAEWGQRGVEQELAWTRPLQILARKHDVVPIQLADRLELALPRLGVAWVEDPETGETFRVDLADGAVRKAFEKAMRLAVEQRKRLFARLRLDTVTVRSDDAEYVKPLVTFFRARAKRMK
jgi:uncharacterized protein (DUF58 family)